MEWSEREQCWYRDDPTDRAILAERNEYAPLDFGSSSCALDLGAHIGTFLLKATRGGVDHVVAVEPSVGNLAVLERNLTLLPYGKRVTLLRGAATGAEGSVMLWEHETALSSHSTVQPKRLGTKHPVEVMAYNFATLVWQYQPDLIKMDIEGAEYDLWDSFHSDIPAFVRQLAVELHFGRKAWFEVRAPALIHRIESQGFRPVRPAKMTGSPWNTTPIWRRP